MQKKILLISICIFVLTGCVRIDKDSNQDYADLVVNCLKNNAYTNDVALGYKYYLPKGVKLLKNYNYNQKFLVGTANLYMYVDINSYYYKTDINYDDSNSFYYEKINYDGKSGYIKIDKVDNNYYTKIVYNYAKMEFYSDYVDLNKLISFSAIILNSIDYNKKIIEKVLDENLGEYSDITYEIQKPEDASSNFSQYLEEYVQDDDAKAKLPDE
jgi:hypothetical protein